MTALAADPSALSMALVLGVLALGAVWGWLTPSILRRLPEPEADSGSADSNHEEDLVDDLDDKIPYAVLATRPFAISVGLVAVLGAGLAALTLPAHAVLPWLVLATLGVLLAAIDARTTWLPLPLTRIAWAAMAVAVGGTGLLGGWAVALQGLVGFALAGAIFGAIWLLTRGGFGFGDVRYAPLVGAATASVSWTVLAWGLVLGSLVGAVVGLVRLAQGRRGAFPYAPSILAGGYLAIALAWLTT